MTNSSGSPPLSTLMNRQRLLAVVALEKQRLDNRSVVGGFDRFMRLWGRTMGVPGWSDAETYLESYLTLSMTGRRRLINTLEKMLTQLPETGRENCEKREKPERPTHVTRLREPVRSLQGVGPVLDRKLAQLGVRTLGDFLYAFPRTYRDRGEILSLSDLQEGRLLTVEAVVFAQHRIPTRRKRLLKIVLAEGDRKANLVCFNQEYLARILLPGKRVKVTGTFSFRYGAWETSDFDFEVVNETGHDDSGFLRIQPVYSLTEGLSQKRFYTLVSEVLDEFLEDVEEVLPESVRTRYKLVKKQEAIRELHRPRRSNFTELIARNSVAHRSIIFEECLVFALGLRLKRQAIKKVRSRSYSPQSTLVRHFLDSLPYRLTKAQEQVFREIVADLTRPIPMSRLVQGDVGSGKTVIALLGALQVIGQGSQVAMMVPTEILAEQHHQRWKDPLEKLGVTVGLLRGGTGREKNTLIKAIKQKTIDLVIGTHALIQDQVIFADLGLVIVDEQHRFGVTQRSRLQEKAEYPHVLVMSATPIPRTLALTLYGDLDISVVDQKPAGRKKIVTCYFREDERHKAYNRVAGFLDRGHQAYVVCPAIEENDDEMVSVRRIFEELQNKWLKDARIAMLHGRLSLQEKEAVMRRFVQREIDVVVATSVIEVGVDVPTANVMVVENAERFGLAQLHQLRGRIGRGESEALCILLTRSAEGPALERVRIMTTIDDGFVIAEEDLKMRGPGEFFGTRQHGLSEFRLTDPLTDWPVLEQAVHEAGLLLEEDPDLSLSGNKAICREVEERFAYRFKAGELG
ncbi:MAG TPA: ATP-dependent DNA helicase RecG [Atribacteraceae bacterium]|nr:ATP-dependent DNA helicase RecG [Atribacteraceae bacterium]